MFTLAYCLLISGSFDSLELNITDILFSVYSLYLRNKPVPLHSRATCIFHLSQYLANLMRKICFTISFILCLYMWSKHVEA